VSDDEKTITLMSDTPDWGYMRLKDVLRVIPVSKSTWWEGIRAGYFPKGIKLKRNITVWQVRDIRQLAEKIKEEADKNGTGPKRRKHTDTRSTTG